MRHFETYHSHADAFAGHGFLERFGHAARKSHQCHIVVLLEIEQIVVFDAGYHQHMTGSYGVDVEESIMAVVCRNLVRRYFAVGDASKES
jgi:hypothetical protein